SVSHPESEAHEAQKTRRTFGGILPKPDGGAPRHNSRLKPKGIAHMVEIAERGYAHPEVLVSTDWVEQHLHDPSVRLIESNEDTLLYSSGHIPGAVHVD